MVSSNSERLITPLVTDRGKFKYNKIKEVKVNLHTIYTPYELMKVEHRGLSLYLYLQKIFPSLARPFSYQCP